MSEESDVLREIKVSYKFSEMMRAACRSVRVHLFRGDWIIVQGRSGVCEQEGFGKKEDMHRGDWILVAYAYEIVV